MLQDARSAEKVNEFVTSLQTILSLALNPYQVRKIKEQCFKSLSAPDAVPTKTARQSGRPPKWATEMVDIFNRVVKDPLDSFVIDGMDMVTYMEWWRCLPPERLFDAPKRRAQADGITMSSLAMRLFCCWAVSLARSQSANADEFFRAALTVIAVDHLPEMVRSEGWRFRFRCCEDPRCRQCFLDRSPRWQTVPARFCCDQHRARTFKARRKASHASS